jgi:ABC-2 type transport system permease protein
MLLFFIYLAIIFLFSFAFLGSISLLSFWVTEAYAIRWAATILVRFLSGILVPVLFFPESIQKLLYLSPFPYLAYAPIQLLSNSLSLTKAWEGLLTLCVWTVVTWGIYLLLFRRGIAKYEGVGI